MALPRSYQRDCWLGALSAALMLIGDLCLSVIPASPGDSGLFLRQAYLNGSYPAWRLPLLATGLAGMALAFFSVRACHMQIKPQYRKTRLTVLIGGVIYIATAAARNVLLAPARVADHCSNIGVCVTQVNEDLYDTHSHLNIVKSHPDETFYHELEDARIKYQLS